MIQFSVGKYQFNGFVMRNWHKRVLNRPVYANVEIANDTFTGTWGRNYEFTALGLCLSVLVPVDP